MSELYKDQKGQLMTLYQLSVRPLSCNLESTYIFLTDIYLIRLFHKFSDFDKLINDTIFLYVRPYFIKTYLIP